MFKLVDLIHECLDNEKGIAVLIDFKQKFSRVRLWEKNMHAV